jgi:hypothetical protein
MPRPSTPPSISRISTTRVVTSDLVFHNHIARSSQRPRRYTEARFRPETGCESHPNSRKLFEIKILPASD